MKAARIPHEELHREGQILLIPDRENAENECKMSNDCCQI
jgi:hypothetical protein